MKWFENFSMARKLLAGFGLTTLILIGVGLFSTSSLRRLSQADTALYETMTVPLAELAEWNYLFGEHQKALRDVVLKDDPQERAALVAYMSDLSARINPLQDHLKDLFVTEEGQRLYDRVTKARQAFLAPNRRVLELVEAGRMDEAETLLHGALAQAGDDYSAALRAMTANKVEVAAATAAANDDVYHDARTLILIAILIGALLSVGVAWFLASALSKRLGVVVERAQELQQRCITNLGNGAEALSRGDVDYEIDYGTPLLKMDSEDEVGVMADTVDAIIRQSVATIQAFESAQRIVKELVAETADLTEAGQQGRLDSRADASKFQGEFHALVSGVNGLLDAVIDPVTEAAEVLDRVAARDMTARVEGEYRGDHARIKKALNAAVQNLEQALQDVSGASEQVASAADEITSSSQDLAEGTGEQASSLEEVTSSLQELSSMSRQNSANAGEAATMARDSMASLDEASERMQRLSAAIQSIKDSSDSTAKIVKTIDEIAFQTNLLALNAAVEAARAGDAGKGFAVVAEEVRNLAMRSAEAARNTAELIQAAVENADSGVGINAEVLESLEQVAQKTRRSNEVIAEIAAASEQQSQGVEQINTAVEQMNAVTQQTAASSEEGASTAEELSSQADQLRLLVGGFRLHAAAASPSGGASAPVAPRTAPANGHRPKPNGRARNGAAKATGRSELGPRNRITRAGDPADLIPFDDDDTLTQF